MRFDPKNPKFNPVITHWHPESQAKVGGAPYGGSGSGDTIEEAIDSAATAEGTSVADTGGNFTGTDVEAVLAEIYAAISGGGIPATIFDAAGDLIVASAPDTAARLPIGSALQHLRVNSGATALEYADPISGLPWFDVTAYGATGDGLTDDTSDINDAIAAWNTAGVGTLYFPAGQYLCSGALTTITAEGMVLGDGPGGFDGTGAGSEVLCSSDTAVLFSTTAYRLTFRDLGIRNTAGSTPSAGAGISVAGATGLERVDYENISVTRFYDDVTTDGCTGWTMRGCWLRGPVRYGIRIRNTVNPDAGDWSISDTGIFAATQDADAGIRIESSGGGKIVNCKINASVTVTNAFDYGIDLAVATGINTVILLVTNCSIENIDADAIRVTSAGTGQWRHLNFHGNQVGLWGNNSGYAINVAPSNTDDVEHILISSNIFTTNGTARSAVNLVNTDNVILSSNLLVGFDDLYDSSGSTNIVEVAGGVSDHGGLTGLADDDHPQYLDEARHDVHDHTGVPGVGSGSTLHELVIASVHSSPLVFEDLVQNSEGTDLVYNSA